MGEINNSAKVMDTCQQQSTVNGTEVTLFTPIGELLTPFYFLYLSNKSHNNTVYYFPNHKMHVNLLSPIMTEELTMTE